MKNKYILLVSIFFTMFNVNANENSWFYGSVGYSGVIGLGSDSSYFEDLDDFGTTALELGYVSTNSKKTTMFSVKTLVDNDSGSRDFKFYDLGYTYSWNSDSFSYGWATRFTHVAWKQLWESSGHDKPYKNKNISGFYYGGLIGKGFELGNGILIAKAGAGLLLDLGGGDDNNAIGYQVGLEYQHSDIGIGLEYDNVTVEQMKVYLKYSF